MENVRPAKSNQGLWAVRLGLATGLALLFIVASLWSLHGMTPAHAAPGILYVDGATGSDDSDCTNSTGPCATIGYALSQAGSGDAIRVAQGIYTETLDVSTPITLTGGYESVGWTRSITQYETVLNGNQTGTVVVFQGGSGDGSVLDGLTITGGSGDSAGGVDTSDASVTIRNCLIRDNFGNGMPDYFGAGGVVGGGGGKPLTIMDSRIVNNQVNGGAGGVRSYDGLLVMVNSIVADNHGDAAIHANGPVSLMNVTIARNDGGVLFNPPGEATLDVTNSILWQNQWSITEDPPATRLVTYSLIEGGWTGTGNIDADPQFVDASNGDYHLQAWSPAIDAGTAASAPDHDFEGDPRPQNAGYDMGADEFVGTPLPSEGPRYVATAGSDAANPCLDPAIPCQTIGHALAVANAGESVLVAQGTYTENVEISGKELTIRGGYTISGTQWLTRTGTTVVDGSQVDRTFVVHDGSEVALEDMTITGGIAPEEACWGGGVQVTNGSATLRRTIVQGNQAMCTSGQSGGGAGGGLNAVFDEGPASLFVEDSFILDNLAGDHGSAVGTDQVTVVLTNVVIAGNNYNQLAVHMSDLTLVNSTIADNSVDGSSILDFDSASSITVLNSIVWNSGSIACGGGGGTCDITYSDIEGGWTGAGNIDADPMFMDEASSDFHLLPGSPAVDGGTPAGAPATDLEGTPRDATPDMGAYEWGKFRIFLPLVLRNFSSGQ